MPELRDRIDELLDRVEAGEVVRINRDGVPVAELRPLAHPLYTTEELQERRRDLPPMDLEAFRADVDPVIYPHIP